MIYLEEYIKLNIKIYFFVKVVDNLIKYIHKSDVAIVVLHEIYGINSFIEDVCQKYYKYGYDVFCPELLGEKEFSIFKVQEAYDFFINNVGLIFIKS